MVLFVREVGSREWFIRRVGLGEGQGGLLNFVGLCKIWEVLFVGKLIGVEGSTGGCGSCGQDVRSCSE